MYVGLYWDALAQYHMTKIYWYSDSPDRPASTSLQPAKGDPTGPSRLPCTGFEGAKGVNRASISIEGSSHFFGGNEKLRQRKDWPKVTLV